MGGTLKMLVYFTYVAKDKTYTREAFEGIFSVKKKRDKMMRSISQELAHIRQFNNDEEVAESKEEKQETWIADLVDKLISYGGVDQRYIMYDMRLFEINETTRDGRVNGDLDGRYPITGIKLLWNSRGIPVYTRNYWQEETSEPINNNLILN